MSKIEEYRQAPEGMIQFVRDVQPRILDTNRKVIPFEFADFQLDTVRKALSTNDDGNYKYQTVIISYPRRHSKSTIAALITLWRFCCFPNQNIKVIGNTERQVNAVCAKKLKDSIRFTPVLRKWIGLENIKFDSINLPKQNNRIEFLIAGSKHLYGESIDLAWLTEIHEKPNDTSTYDTMVTSMGDVMNSQIILDSTVDQSDGLMHRLEQIAEEQPNSSICTCRLEYSNKKEALAKAPSWIPRQYIHDRERDLFPAEFARLILNKRSEAENTLLPYHHLKKCRADYAAGISKKELVSMVGNRKVIVGGGLDRGNPFSQLASNTVWTSVAKVSRQDGEPEFYVLNQEVIFGSLGRGIKKAIETDMNRYDLNNFVLENVNVADIRSWSADRGYSFEMVSPTAQNQEPAFLELYHAVKDDRLFIPKELKKLFHEMRTMTYHFTNNNSISFGKRNKKDDRVYSLVWALYSLRNRELSSYELDVNIVCKSNSPYAKQCYLRGGTEVLIECADTCPAHQRVKEMYNSYIKYNVDTNITIPIFYKSFVDKKGIKMYKAI
jgi:hypothetical protein